MTGIGMPELTPYQQRQFIKALGEAYGSFGEIAHLFRSEFGVDLADIVDLESPISKGARKLLAWAAASGLTRRLGMVLFRGNPPLMDYSRLLISGERHFETMSPRPTRSPAPAAAAPEEPAIPPSFYFRLEGAGVRCDQVTWGAEFALIFNYGVDPHALARLAGKKLKALEKGKHELIVAINPVGFSVRDDVTTDIARIKDGKITKPPTFQLQAPAKDAGPLPERTGISVSLTYQNAPLYDFFLALHLVDKLASAPCQPKTIDLDLGDLKRAKAEPRDAILFLSSEGEVWNVHWIIGDSAPKSRKTSITASKLAGGYQVGLLKEVDAIAGQATWKAFTEDLKTAPGSAAAMQSAMSVGWQLYDLLAKDPVFSEALALLDALEDGSKITVKTDGIVFPWELLYPLEYTLLEPDKNFDRSRFWGARFEIESLMFTNSTPEKQPADRRQPKPLFVSMGFNDSIDADWKGRPLIPVGFQKTYCDGLGAKGAYAKTRDELISVFTKPLQASMIYFFCHGAGAQLEFEKNKTLISPSMIPSVAYPNWPIVFMNTCEAGDINPLSFVSFREKFRDKRAAGIVAPSFKIPTLFAAVFGKALLDRYAAGEPIGRALLALRKSLVERDVPLGLWYSLQCPLDVKAPLS